MCACVTEIPQFVTTRASIRQVSVQRLTHWVRMNFISLDSPRRPTGTCWLPKPCHLARVDRAPFSWGCGKEQNGVILLQSSRYPSEPHVLSSISCCDASVLRSLEAPCAKFLSRTVSRLHHQHQPPQLTPSRKERP